ncbi:putative selenate ABC transporter substrate-binding protein [Roseateles amylovorans]|uniref:Selenate ABC transporter substrate-binding protein n=1 Tax=Roseateles amylovorans TaxID=2978473 RepID=A0ABY6B4Y6_9BURK|nr:putative selenate ABC transporter substrate-binding protein [Roseateles amylovorans]UXH79907.1 putative selenate ABC transporter substrate-binding protein [Roseateles amylovorans]
MSNLFHHLHRAVRGFSVAALVALSTVGAAHAQTVLRVTAIPDESPTELARKFAPLGKYLEKELGVKVEWTPVTDYAAAVEAVVNKKIDLAWFGGFTFVQANVRSGGKVVPLVQREEDEKFRSVFITDAKSGITKLDDLKGKTLSFGSASSTSGHLMPRSFLLAAKINPESDLKRISFSGAHDATVAAVASGKVDAGALNISVWEKLLSEKKVDPAEVKVFFTTPTYYDYNWSVHADMPAAMKEKLKQAFLKLSDATPEGKEILGLQRATKFVPTKPENYTGIKAAAENAGLLK